MVVNRDEALKCLGIARSALADGNYARAERFARKSLALHEMPDATALLAEIQAAASAAPSPTDAEGMRQRKPAASASEPSPSSSASASRSASAADVNSGSSERQATPEQIAAVKKVQARRAADFYGVLGLEKDASDADIKKAYRKLALALHPDKNPAPGADEAFKKISKAFSILSDSDKRRQFDQLGTDPDSRSGGGGGGGGPGMHPFFTQRGGRGGHSFEAEIDPEELFRAFFGGSGFGFAQPGGQQHFFYGDLGGRRRAQQQQQSRARGSPQGNPATGLSLLQFAPIIMIILFTLVNVFFAPPDMPDYSFTPSRHFSHQHATPRHKVDFYVHGPSYDAFKQHHAKYVPQFYEGVEATYVNRLGNSCTRERQARDQAVRRAYGWGFGQPDKQQIQRARNLPTPSCDRLREMGLYK
ncbi:hypothetical protein AMAG_15085 [Allomyces macrogynus ATCC 38327]|uniref:J domain-containing protein n=1 Tax=Allomyces macrogynus (strain ATCC 38327) TaxID=578462 RepID=A0A0L0T5T3_ALLM3|nr:hypothetical protein AMAG_15085 [Allomyces macrogynus ATCC 38327]|eukprot:KNE70107.1 hypothetical protein AMAG_15085 [Allomyces macrogynus ATCC 38327]